jgi:hypothetical protein
MESIIDQLRVHDGKLFQNEYVLSLYVDIKRILLDNILMALHTPGGLQPFMDWSDSLADALARALVCGNAGVLLDRTVSMYASEMSMTRKDVSIKDFLHAVVRRLCSDPCVVSKQIVTLDPIKQDFVCREAFRRALLEFVESVKEIPKVDDEHPEVQSQNEVVPDTIRVQPVFESLETPGMSDGQTCGIPDDIRPEDSASQVASQFVLPNEPKQADGKMSVVKSTIRSVMKPAAPAPLPAPSAPLVRAESVVSGTSGMTMKYPKIRKVVLDDDTSTVFNRTTVTKH